MKIAILGLGLMGSFYARILADRLGPANVIGVELDTERAEAVARQTGITTTDDWRGLLGQVDAVAVTLPDHLHVAPTVAFLQEGAYVLVEKPLATSTEDCELVLKAQVAPGRLMVGQLLRFDPRTQELKRRLDAGEFGPLRYVKVWRANPTSGAARVGTRVGVSAFLGVHDLDLLMWLTGRDVVSANASGRKIFGDHWDISVACLELDGGLFAQVENHWLIHPAAQRSCLAGVEVFGEAGQALLDLSTQELEVVSDSAPITRRVDTHNWTFDEAMSGGNLRRELEAFVRAVERGEPCPVPGEEGARAVRAVELVEQSLAHNS
ncbi:Gfo/Idh/MocA family protein [Aestuariimicrobium sp. Y1814]|uniref:Gfo/Idh/MocA family protein n=1 Tax=Aestuariimicrobium sp. Y1814 TaxID=3418742 RepID=UPI003DA6EDAF